MSVVAIDGKIISCTIGHREPPAQYTTLINRHRCNMICVRISPLWDEIVHTLDFSGVQDKAAVVALSLEGQQIIYSPEDIAAFTGVRAIELNVLYDIGGVADIDYTRFKNLNYMRCWHMKGNDTPFQNPAIQSLVLNNVRQQKNLHFLHKMTGLKTLGLSATHLPSLDGLEQFQNLEKLSLYNCHKLTSLAPVLQLPKLKSLEVWNCKKITDLPNITRMATLERIRIQVFSQTPAFWLQMPHLKYPIIHDAKNNLITWDLLPRKINPRGGESTDLEAYDPILHGIFSPVVQDLMA